MLEEGDGDAGGGELLKNKRPLLPFIDILLQAKVTFIIRPTPR